ncbi:type I-E CRISPR-associated protein Cse2/CasB [Varibaculum cambriense]|uniref:type I-E CRISPR-associated protein Cse2/CasB n=1 Tax=Varibaculum cambriense TaxID=184870 RepID=UPI0037DD9FB7
MRVGQSFALASRKLSELGGDYSANDPAKPDAIASRLRVIQFLDIEQAVLVIRGLLSLCKKTEIPLNYYALARILVHWGNGVTPQSKKMRQAMVRDYYGYVPARG